MTADRRIYRKIFSDEYELPPGGTGREEPAFGRGRSPVRDWSGQVATSSGWVQLIAEGSLVEIRP
jgi:hypothetical protein